MAQCADWIVIPLGNWGKLGRVDANLSACALAVKRYDRDRWFCALFAPSERREDLLALYAFNAELAGVAEKVSEPLLGDIRLQWWREAIDGLYGGATRHHDVVMGLEQAIARHDLDRALFDRLIDAREFDLSGKPPDTLEELETYALETSAPLMRLALGILDAGSDAASRAANAGGTAFALTGLLRATPYLLNAGRIMLPTQTMTQHGLTERELRAGRGGKAVADTVKAVADRAHHHLKEAYGFAAALPRRAVPALLPVSLAASDLARLTRLNYDVFDPRLAERGAGRMLNASARALFGRL